ncbi:NAD(P)-binding protein [Calocera cornea HHB12733]|uniref:NAD(P)-binding protein n=1 Tax=Calocera cornea HHB12733 TaxID=1353952 RepID=A0A165HZK7_9BASI|nr:NAD(P)-binding protein [Calocera cornea HHB12733]
MSDKLVLVTGATGNQGGSVVNALLKNGGYQIRALTRNVDSAPAMALAEKGVEVVGGELNDKESVSKACKGAYAVFGVTTPSGHDEFVLGSNLVDACKENNVEVLVWSSLPSCKDTSNGKWACSVFDNKAEVDKYIKAVDQPAVIFKTGGFTENLLSMSVLKRDEQDGSKYHTAFTFTTATRLQPYTYVAKDLGPAVVAAIDKWEDPTWRAELTKESIPLISYQMTGKEVVETISKLTGREVDFTAVKREALPPFLRELDDWTEADLWGYGDQFPVDILLKLGVKLHTLEDYVREEVIPWMNKYA